MSGADFAVEAGLELSRWLSYLRCSGEKWLADICWTKDVWSIFAPIGTRGFLNTTLSKRSASASAIGRCHVEASTSFVPGMYVDRCVGLVWAAPGTVQPRWRRSSLEGNVANCFPTSLAVRTSCPAVTAAPTHEWSRPVRKMKRFADFEASGGISRNHLTCSFRLDLKP